MSCFAWSTKIISVHQQTFYLSTKSVSLKQRSWNTPAWERGMGNTGSSCNIEFGPWLLITLLSPSGFSVGSCVLRSQRQFITHSICYRITCAVFQQKFCWFMLQELLMGNGWKMLILSKCFEAWSLTKPRALNWLFRIEVLQENWEQVSAEAGSNAARKYRVW